MAEPVENAASADAVIITPGQKEETVPKHPSKSPAKRPRFSKSPGGRRGGTAYVKNEPSISLSITPRRQIYPIFVSNFGCHYLAQMCYEAIRGRDYRLANAISVLQLQYVLCIAYCNRIVQTSIENGYAMPLGASRLRQSATGIQLPSVLAQYIESIGMVQLASSATIAPFSGDYRVLFPVDSQVNLDPATILEAAGRPVPPGDWALDIDWIVAYNDATTRASRSGMRFRKVDHHDYHGRVEMAVSYNNTPDDLLLPVAPQVMSEAEAQLGASYHFRNYAERAEWLGENIELLHNTFAGIPFDPRIVVSDICVAAFRGATISMD